MFLGVLGVDALDPDLVDPASHPNLCHEDYGAIDTITSHTGEPSTHELWRTIITGLPPKTTASSSKTAWRGTIQCSGSEAQCRLPAP